MEKSDLYIGVDVSKKTLDICVLFQGGSTNFYKIDNNFNSISSFCKDFVDLKAFFVFETTGVYSYSLAKILTSLNLKFSELNPNKISHFLKYYSRAKTDKIDASNLALYASIFYRDLSCSNFNERDVVLKSYKSSLRLLNKIKAQLLNFQESLNLIDNPPLSTRIKTIITNIQEHKEIIENSLFDLVCNAIPQTSKIIQENKGIGVNLAIYLFPILYFNKDKNYKQIISFLGLAPRQIQSGTSVNKKPCINRMGSNEIRSILFMSALVSVRFNPYFKAFYEKLINKGKPKKVALIAVCNKIIKYLKENYFSDKT